jgi:hypothetical protein
MFILTKEIFEKCNTVLNFQTRTSAYVVFTNIFLFMSCLLTYVRGDKNAAPWRRWLVQLFFKNNIYVFYTHMREGSEKAF